MYIYTTRLYDFIIQLYLGKCDEFIQFAQMKMK